MRELIKELEKIPEQFKDYQVLNLASELYGIAVEQVEVIPHPRRTKRPKAEIGIY